jgi:copper oxidase (laccase) domain-containing protein
VLVFFLVFLKINMESGKKLSLFDDQVALLHTGTEFGTVHPKHPKFDEQFGKLLDESGQDRVLAQKLAFNTKVTPISDLSALEIGQGMKAGELLEIQGFYRTPEASDGVVVSLNGDTRLKIAVAIMNADCGVVEILAPNGELAVLHGGFDNIDNSDGTSIVENAIKYFKEQGFNSSQLRFRVGEAAQACCYGFKTANPEWMAKNQTRAERLQKQFGFDVVRVVENLPRKDGIGFNVPLIAARQAEKMGVSDLSVEELCTSCHGLTEEAMSNLDTYGTWYSNLREKPATVKENGFGSRNVVLVYPNA